jgi:hypothetical protein
MKVAMITIRMAELAALRAGLEQRSALVEDFHDGWSFLQAARARRWDLVLVDGVTMPFRELTEDLLAVNAALPTAVITALAPEAFHEAAEGLGILCALPARPGAAEVGPLLLKLQAIGGLDPAVETAQARLDAAKFKQHPRCVVCWDRHPFGLQVNFRATGAHAVEGYFGCGKSYEGYENILHGGIVSSLLDGAMASCVLALGLQAYTVDLRVRYRAAVAVGVPAIIRGEWLRGSGPIHLLHATLEQDGKVRASARAKFFEGNPVQPSQPLPGGSDVRQLLKHARKRLI